MDEMGKADTHSHTDYSGFNHLGVMKFPESVIDPEVQVDRARREGLDVLCVTDHNEVAGGFIAEKYAKKFDDIEVVVGDEIMTDQGEVIGLWLTEKPKKFLTPEETVDIVHEQGGLCIAPHPFSVHVDGMQEKIFEIPIEGFETINGGHPDPYSNLFAQKIMDLYPGRWAATSGSDAHSTYTAGYNWTEFPGHSADDLRKAILDKTTVPKGVPAPVLGQVQWSMEVVYGGQKLMYKALKRTLEPVKDNALIDKILSNSDLKNATGLVAGCAYLMPLTSMLATLLSTAYLKSHAKKALKNMDERIAKIQKLIAEIDSKNGKAVNEATDSLRNDIDRKGAKAVLNGARRDLRDHGLRSRTFPFRTDGLHRPGHGTGLSRLPQVLLLLPGQRYLEDPGGRPSVRRESGGDHGLRRDAPEVRLQEGGPTERAQDHRPGTSL